MLLHATVRTDLRVKPRKPLHYPAWIESDDGSAPRVCMIWDISESGARLTKTGEDCPPDTFTIRLSNDGKLTRRCRVVWRSGVHLGIEFLRDAPSTALDC